MTPTIPPTSPYSALLQRVRELALEMIGTTHGRDFWMKHPNPELGGQSPEGLIVAGRGDVVEKFLQANLTGDFG